MKAPDKIQLDTCSFSDIGIFDVDEEEVVYIKKDFILQLLNKEEELDSCAAMFEEGVWAGKKQVREEIKEKINNL